MIFQKNSVRLKKWIAGRYSSCQTKWPTTFKNAQLQVVFWKSYIVFTKIWCFKYILLTVAVPKN